MIELPDVTLACVETRHHDLALDALRACLETCPMPSGRGVPMWTS